MSGRGLHFRRIEPGLYESVNGGLRIEKIYTSMQHASIFSWTIYERVPETSRFALRSRGHATLTAAKAFCRQQYSRLPAPPQYAVVLDLEGGKHEPDNLTTLDPFDRQAHLDRVRHINDRIAAGSPFWTHFRAVDAARVVRVN